MNILSTEIVMHHCHRYSYVGLENLQNVEKYFPTSIKTTRVKNDTVDWSALLHVDNDTTFSNFNRSFNILEKLIETHTQRVLDAIFKSPVTVFE